MTEQWRPIDGKWPQPAMVMVRGPADRGHFNVLLGDRGASDWIPRTALRPMPPTVTSEQQAVLDAAVRHARCFEVRAPVGNTERDLMDAVDAMLAVQQPPDPVKELRAAWSAGGKPSCQDWVARMEAAIAALEAKS